MTTDAKQCASRGRACQTGIYDPREKGDRRSRVSVQDRCGRPSARGAQAWRSSPRLDWLAARAIPPWRTACNSGPDWRQATRQATPRAPFLSPRWPTGHAACTAPTTGSKPRAPRPSSSMLSWLERWPVASRTAPFWLFWALRCSAFGPNNGLVGGVTPLRRLGLRVRAGERRRNWDDASTGLTWISAAGIGRKSRPVGRSTSRC